MRFKIGSSQSYGFFLACDLFFQASLETFLIPFVYSSASLRTCGKIYFLSQSTCETPQIGNCYYSYSRYLPYVSTAGGTSILLLLNSCGPSQILILIKLAICVHAGLIAKERPTHQSRKQYSVALYIQPRYFLMLQISHTQYYIIFVSIFSS